MLVGWEAPNTPEVIEETWALFTASKGNLLKTRLYHPISVYERALQINPATEFLLRPTDEGRLNAREQFEKARPRIAELRAHGIKLRFITWSEPNHPDGRYGGPDSVEGAWQFIAELELFVLLLRDAFPDLLLVSPPLAVPWNEPLWDEVCDRVFRLHNYLGRHIYWQGDNELSPDWGLRILAAHDRFPQMRCVVCEIGDSSNDGKPESEWVWATIRYSRIARCLEALKGLGWVDGAAIFILPGTPEWRGFWPDLEAARAVATLVLSSGDNDPDSGDNDPGSGSNDNNSGSNGGSMSLSDQFPQQFAEWEAAGGVEANFRKHLLGIGALQATKADLLMLADEVKASAQQMQGALNSYPF